MESLDSVNSTQKNLMHNMEEENGVEDDFDYGYHQYKDDEDGSDDIDDEEFCSSVVKPPKNEIIGGINLKDLCEGKEVMFQLNDKYLKNDEEQFYEQEDDKQDYDDEKTVNFHKGGLERTKDNEIDLFLDESFESLVSRMTSITDDDCIKKEVITGGIGNVIPENSFIVVHYNLFKETSEEPFDSTYLRKRPERINLGQNDLVPGLEIAIKTMRKRERSRFFIKWNYAFGALGCPDRIEPRCDIIADIKLLNFEEIDVSGSVNECGSSFERSVLQIKLEQTSASDNFKEGNIKQAIRKYKISTRMINNLVIANDRDESIYRELKMKNMVNLAVCYNKLGQYELACVMCQEALSINPKNAKALFHYARASIALSNFTKARSLLIKLNKMHPNNQYINEEFRKLDLKKEFYNMATKDFWKKAFKIAPEKMEHETKHQESNSPCKNSRDQSNGGYKEEFKESIEKNEKHRLPLSLIQQDDISSIFQQNMNLKCEEQCENFMELE